MAPPGAELGVGDALREGSIGTLLLLVDTARVHGAFDVLGAAAESSLRLASSSRRARVVRYCTCRRANRQQALLLEGGLVIS